jgi:hypothetical protein
MLYRFFGQWAEGDFEADYDPTLGDPKHLEDIPESERPEAIDRAALHHCMGGPFHPGCEMTWPMRHSSMYRAPFRLRERVGANLNVDYGEYITPVVALSFDGPLSASGPGDITKWMAVPWQSDTDSCRAGYPSTPFPNDDFMPTFWPSRVPNHVLAETEYRVVIDSTQPLESRNEAFHTRKNWLRNLNFTDPTAMQLDAMVQRFGQQGIVERREHDSGSEFPSVMYVETLPVPIKEEGAKSAAPDHTFSVSEEFAFARFPRLRRYSHRVL